MSPTPRPSPSALATLLTALACLAGLTVGACSSPPTPDAEIEDAAVEDVAVEDAEIVDAAAAPPRKSLVPSPSGRSAWGVAIPLGCTPTFARPEWIECRCRISLSTLTRFFRFRFPGGKTEGLGRGYRFTPGVDRPGYAILNRFEGPGDVKSRLLIFAGRAPDDEGARTLIDRLAPARSRLPRDR